MSIMFKPILRSILPLFFVSASISFLPMQAMSSMPSRRMKTYSPPVEYLELEKIIKYYKTKPFKKTSSPNILDWSLLAKNAVGVTQLVMSNRKTLEQVTVEDIVIGMVAKIESLEWKLLTDQKIKQTLFKWRNTLKASFGENSFSWAWVEFQMGNKKNSKQILQTLFESEYQKIIQSQTRPRGAPFSYSKFMKPLLLLSTKEEKLDMQNKLKKIETHISNLPDLNILT